ncbi:MAG: squalene/phytoene synthase family protein [Deltaproteobacteria bacterium]|nr:squalene/phytoene synthase family protein [Deltaproteobacteria bacterium]
MSAPSVAAGYARCKAIARAHARSFYFASFALFGARRRAAFALYAFCRRLDDLVDEGTLPHAQDVLVHPSVSGAQAVPGPEELGRRLQLARALVSGVFQPFPSLRAATRFEGPVDVAALWQPDELAALRDTVERFGVPEQPLQDLISGMEMDLQKSRYESYEELDLYCYRVAGTVGLMLAPVLGCRDARALQQAAELGKAMQLTNILRDIKEDLGRGRVYLPQEELRAYGISEAQLQAGAVDGRWVDFMRWQVARARECYARAEVGIAALGAFGGQAMVRLMGEIYGAILNAIERQGYDVFRARAHTTGLQKLGIALSTLLGRAGVLRPRPVLPASTAVQEATP